jgi:hypothetical protein
MPRSGTGYPVDRNESPARLRERAAHMRRLARDYQGKDGQLMLEFAGELDEKARQIEAAANDSTE